MLCKKIYQFFSHNIFFNVLGHLSLPQNSVRNYSEPTIFHIQPESLIDLPKFYSVSVHHRRDNYCMIKFKPLNF